MTWEIAIALLGMLGMLVPFGTMLWKLSSILTKLAAAVQNLASEQKEMRCEIQERSDRIEKRVDSAKSDIKMLQVSENDHEKRISILEAKGGDRNEY